MSSLICRKTLIVYFLTGWMLILSGCKKDSDVPVTGTFKDSRDQKVYSWVIAGSQTWMAENLAYLPAVSPANEGSDTLPFYYVFRYEGTNVAAAKEWTYYSSYGVFYNWPAAMAGADSSSTIPSGVRGICPEGWHLPSDGEWDILVNFLGGEYKAGVEMKSTRGWNRYEGESGQGNNSSRFNALPAGARHNEGGFYNLGYNALFWSSTGFREFSAWNRFLGYSHDGVYRYYFNKRFGFSIRFIKNG